MKIALLILAAVSAHNWNHENWLERKLEYIHVEENQEKNIIFLSRSYGNAQTLLPLATDYRIKNVANSYLISLPNHGNSYDDDRSSLTLITDDIHKFIEDSGLKKVYLVGHNLGARVAYNLATRHGLEIKGVVALDFLPFGWSASQVKDQQKTIKGLQALNLKQTASQITADALKVISDPQLVKLIVDAFEGTEGDYKPQANLENIRKNIGRLFKKPVRVNPFYGKFKLVIGSQSPNYSPSQIPQLKDYYPKIDLDKDVITVKSGNVVYQDFFDTTIQAILDVLA